MSLSVWIKRLWLCTGGAALVYLFWIYPRLPERVASKFDFSNHPVAFMQKSSLLVLLGVLIVFVNGVFLIFGTKMIRKFPLQLLNVPHRDYWLGQKSNLEEAYRRIGLLISGIGLGFNFLQLICMHLIFQQNGGDVFFRVSVGWVLAFALLAPVALLFSTHRLFKIPGSPPRQDSSSAV